MRCRAADRGTPLATTDVHNKEETQTMPGPDALARGWMGIGCSGGEFDPGSGSTLAACLMHASRTGCSSERSRGGRVRSAWLTCPRVGGSAWKRVVIPHTLGGRVGSLRKDPLGSPVEGAAPD